MPGVSNERVEIKRSLRKTFLHTGLGVLFVAAGWWATTTDMNDFDKYTCVLASVVLGAFALGSVFLAIKGGAAIVITLDGISDRSSLLGSPEFIKWSEIKNMYIYEYKGQKLLGIEPVQAVIDRAPGWKQKVIKANEMLGCPAINIPQAAINVKLESLLETIESFRGRA